MKLAALTSGGKDSLYAAYLAGKENEVTHLISLISENPESYMFHYPNIHLVKRQAGIMGLPITEKTTKGEKEKELDDLEEVLASLKGIDGITTGATASNYQKIRIDSICKKLGLLSVAPLWQRKPEEYMKQMIEDGFEMIIVGVAAPPLNESWLGRKIDEKCIQELIKLNEKHGIHVAGEGGEYESFVTNSPMFVRKIEITEADKNWNAQERSGTYDIKKIKFVPKDHPSS